jgi:hypothetical protein
MKVNFWEKFGELVLTVLCVFFFVTGFVLAFQNLWQRATYNVAEGVIVDVRRVKLDSDTEIWATVVFRAAGGERVEFVDQNALGAIYYEPEEKVPVRYNPAQPQHAEIQSAAKDLFESVTPPCSGFVFLFIYWAFVRRTPRATT